MIFSPVAVKGNRFFDRRLVRAAFTARIGLVLVICSGLLGGVFTVLQARYLSQTIGQAFLADASLASLRPLLIALLCAGLGRAFAVWGSDVAASRVAAQVKRDLRDRLVAQLLALGPRHVRGERTGELTNTVVEGIEALDAYFSQYLPQLALAALLPLTVLFFIFPLDPLSGLVLLLTAPLIPIFMILIGGAADALTRRQWTALSRLSAHFLDALQGLATLKMFNRSREQIQVIAEISDRYRQTTMGVLRVTFLSALTLEWLATLSTAVVAVEVGLRLLYFRLTFEQAFFILILAPEFYLPLRGLGLRFHAGMAGVAAAKRIFEILEMVTPASDTVEPTPRPLQPHEMQIRFTDVCYAYPGVDRDRLALDHVTFDLPPGTLTALVGPSGGGKSTLAQLLLRFDVPLSGAITAAGRPLDMFSLSQWRAGVAWTPQTPYLFNASVAENIRLARPEAPLAAVQHAAAEAGAADFITALPQGYDTVIGERGARLSGGQAQRIALARAFLRDAPLVILDEPTAHLDPAAEAVVQSALERLRAGRTLLVIAHRLNTVRRADRIIVMDRGRVVGVGTHAALLAQGGVYRELVEAWAQGEWTRDDGRRPPDARTGVGRATQSERVTPLGLSQLHAPRVVAPPAATATPSTLHGLLTFLIPFWPWIALSVLLGFITVGSGVGLMATSAWIIASAALHPSVAELQVAIVGVRFFGLVRGLLRYVERLATHQVTFRVLGRIRVWFYAAVEPLAPAGLAAYRSGDLLSRAVADVESLEQFYVRAVAPPLIAAAVTIAMWVFIGEFSRGAAAAWLLCYGVAGIVVPLIAHRLSRQPGRRVVALRAELHAALVDGIQGLADVIAFGQEPAYRARMGGANRALVGTQGRLGLIAACGGAAITLLTSLAVLAVLMLVIPAVNAGARSGVHLAVLALAVAASFEAVQPLPAAAQHLESSLTAARRLFAVAGGRLQIAHGKLRYPELAEGCRSGASTGPSASSGTADTYPAVPPELTVEKLSFQYGVGETHALADVSFRIPAGGLLAIVGPSGAGKSTLVNLLLRFWDYDVGEIRLTGRPLREIAPEAARRGIGVVAQNTYLFSGTVRENLLLARPDAGPAAVAEAIRRAQLHEFVAALPQGYDTWIGEQGLRLSGGERQRLALARALLKDAPLLILDEPTANLDPRTEHDLMQTLRDAMIGRTTLLITHRLQILEPDDAVLVLAAGRVAAHGYCREVLTQIPAPLHT